MPELPYLPMHDPKKQVSQAQMQAILERHAVVPKLKWERITPYCMGSVPVGYTVDKALVRGKPRYTAWQGKVSLGCTDTYGASKALCEAKVRE